MNNKEILAYLEKEALLAGVAGKAKKYVFKGLQASKRYASSGIGKLEKGIGEIKPVTPFGRLMKGTASLGVKGVSGTARTAYGAAKPIGKLIYKHPGASLTAGFGVPMFTNRKRQMYSSGFETMNRKLSSDLRIKKAVGVENIALKKLRDLGKNLLDRKIKDEAKGTIKDMTNTISTTNVKSSSRTWQLTRETADLDIMTKAAQEIIRLEKEAGLWNWKVPNKLREAILSNEKAQKSYLGTTIGEIRENAERKVVDQFKADTPAAYKSIADSMITKAKNSPNKPYILEVDLALKPELQRQWLGREFGKQEKEQVSSLIYKRRTGGKLSKQEKNILSKFDKDYVIAQSNMDANQFDRLNFINDKNLQRQILSTTIDDEIKTLTAKKIKGEQSRAISNIFNAAGVPTETTVTPYQFLKEKIKGINPVGLGLITATPLTLVGTSVASDYKKRSQLNKSYNEMLDIYPEFKNEDQNNVKKYFKYISTYSPTVAMNPHASGALMKRFISGGNILLDPSVISSLITVEKDVASTVESKGKARSKMMDTIIGPITKSLGYGNATKETKDSEF